MRMRGLSLLMLLVLAGCVGSPAGKPHRPPPREPAEDSRALKQCLVDLARYDAKFTVLPDRWFGNGCSATGAVQLTAIGIPVTNLGAMKCRTAERLSAWTNEAVQNAATAWLGSRVIRIESFGTYNCRPRNGVAGAKMSEHGRANAVDIAAFVLADGRRVTVEQGWNGPDKDIRNFLRAVHKAACRRFAIVIGPAGDAAHYNHFHFDMGADGPYCK
ncbi:extensin family protein [Sphingomonas sp. KC8]|uniref:extensin family protein n=1 Tax=Sphingomonas sp. KC8 TaxID=1030157 RepID=UPI0004985AB2|nr:extensin family protein [Sphingomonas sp. KC8]ARS29307.1 extensin family protein [Sphingomonas sp. KC8]